MSGQSVLRLWLTLLLFVHGVLGIFSAFEPLEKLKERGYDLPKRQMFANVLGLILGSSQFPNDGKPMFFVVSHGQSVGVVHSGVGSSHLGEPMGIG